MIDVRLGLEQNDDKERKDSWRAHPPGYAVSVDATQPMLHAQKRHINTTTPSVPSIPAEKSG